MGNPETGIKLQKSLNFIAIAAIVLDAIVGMYFFPINNALGIKIFRGQALLIGLFLILHGIFGLKSNRDYGLGIVREVDIINKKRIILEGANATVVNILKIAFGSFLLVIGLMMLIGVI